MTQNDRNHPDSYYVATAKGMAEHPALAGAHRADICVIGAGYTGLSAALHLAERGYKVILLEARKVGWGASGRNGGQLGSGQRKSQHELERSFGKAAAHELWEIAIDALATCKSLISKHQIDCDITPGILHAAWKASDVDELKSEAEHLSKDYSYPHVRFVAKDEMRQMVASERYWGGLLDENAAHIHPLNFALGLARACTKAGVEIYENSPVTSVSHTDPAVISTPDGTVTAAHVVLACNGYLGNLEGRVSGHIMPINNFVVATEPLGETRARALIRDNVAIADTKFVIDYYRFSADHRLLFGGGENYSSRFPDDIASFVRKPMARVFPQLANVKIDYAWGGTLAITLNRLPDVGRLAPNVFYAHGYSGQGINMATICGKLIAEAVAGTAERFDVMARIPTPTFPGGTWLRYPALVAGMLYYAMRDKLP